jgi:hypothetical protein
MKVPFTNPTRAHGAFPMNMTGVLIQATRTPDGKPAVILQALKSDGEPSTCWMALPVSCLAELRNAIGVTIEQSFGAEVKQF